MSCKYQFAVHPICLHFVWHPQFQHWSCYNVEFSPSSPPTVYKLWHLLPLPQSPLFPAGLPTHLASSSSIWGLALVDIMRIYKLYLLTYKTEAANGWSLAMQYIIWVKKCNFHVSTGSAEALVIWGGKIKHLLIIAYFLDNISWWHFCLELSKSVHVVLSNHRYNIFEMQCSFSLCSVQVVLAPEYQLTYCCVIRYDAVTGHIISNFGDESFQNHYSCTDNWAHNCHKHKDKLVLTHADYSTLCYKNWCTDTEC